MAILYLDTSALVKLYIRETGTDELLQLARPDAGHRLAILSLSRIEFRSALRRRANLGDIDSASLDEMLRTFSVHLASVYLVQPVSEPTFDAAADLIDRYGLRSYDALQLGGCIALKGIVGDNSEIRFVCADVALLNAARSEGLATILPGPL